MCASYDAVKLVCAKVLHVSDLNLFSQAAKKWKVIGSHLNIPEDSLDAIQHDSPGVNEALLAVFTSWRRSMCSTYSWKTILSVLVTDPVGHRRLANDIAHRLSGEIGGLCALFQFIPPIQHIAILSYGTMSFL